MKPISKGTFGLIILLTLTIPPWAGIISILFSLSFVLVAAILFLVDVFFATMLRISGQKN